MHSGIGFRKEYISSDVMSEEGNCVSGRFENFKTKITLKSNLKEDQRK